MAKFRVNKKGNYTVLSNVPIRDKRLSLRAKGLLLLMFSLPDDWSYSVGGLATECTEGRDAIRKALIELEKYGYLARAREREQGTNKLGGTLYDLYDEPMTEKPTLEKPTLENPTLLNKDIQNKDIKYIVDYLNEKLGTGYKATSSGTAKPIQARLNEDFTVDDFKAVIDTKYDEWNGNEQMRPFLRPQTLFGPKFEGYLNQSKVKGGSSGKYCTTEIEADSGGLDDWSKLYE